MMPQRSPCSSHTGRVLACRVRIVRATCCHLSAGATRSGLPVITSRALTASPGTARSLTRDTPFTIGIDDPVDGIAQRMAEQKAGLLPVLDGRRLVGVIHYADMLTHTTATGAMTPTGDPTEVSYRTCICGQPCSSTTRRVSAVATGVRTR